MKSSRYDMIVVTGATASGKTALAARLADAMGGEVISADSRQVYRNMDIGTGKDYSDYTVDGRKVPYHLVDIVDAGYRYNVFEYQRDFLRVYDDLRKRAVLPVVCGGSGMYIDSIIRGYKLIRVPVNQSLRDELATCTLDELRIMLEGYRKLHNRSDVDTLKRAIRAIEIEEYYRSRGEDGGQFPVIKPLVTGVVFDRETRRRRISERLKSRLDEGMVDEVRSLLERGLSPDDLVYYGLEYKFVTLYITGEISYDEMFSRLEAAIHQFAKRQMTWFRGMERRGVKIQWLSGEMTPSAMVSAIVEMFNG